MTPANFSEILGWKQASLLQWNLALRIFLAIVNLHKYKIKGTTNKGALECIILHHPAIYTLKKLQTFAGTMKRSPGTNATTNNITSSTTATKKGRRVRNVVGFAECKDCRWGLADESHVGVAHFPCSCLNFPLQKKMQQQKNSLQATWLPAKHATSSYKKILEGRIFWAYSEFCASTA